MGSCQRSEESSRAAQNSRKPVFVIKARLEAEAWGPPPLPSPLSVAVPAAQNADCFNSNLASVLFAFDFEFVCSTICIDCEDASTSEPVQTRQREDLGSLHLHRDDVLSP